MGHIRLGNLPQTKKWKQVVELIGGGAGAPEVATATLDAAKKGLLEAPKDPGLVHSVWLLTQIPIAAKGENFAEGLRKIGLEVSDNPSLFEVVGAFSNSVDTYLRKHGGRTDLGEMAQMAASESLTALGTEKIRGLFETTSEDVQQALKSFSTTKQFSTLARDFFARLTKRYLTSFLSRELSNHVGKGEKHRFTGIDQHTEFNQALELHCRQASRIVEEFAGGWFSKTNYEEGGIDTEKTAGFVSFALKKLRAELAKRGDDE